MLTAGAVNHIQKKIASESACDLKYSFVGRLGAISCV